MPATITVTLEDQTPPQFESLNQRLTQLAENVQRSQETIRAQARLSAGEIDRQIKSFQTLLKTLSMVDDRARRLAAAYSALSNTRPELPGGKGEKPRSARMEADRTLPPPAPLKVPDSRPDSRIPEATTKDEPSARTNTIAIPPAEPAMNRGGRQPTKDARAPSEVPSPGQAENVPAKSNPALAVPPSSFNPSGPKQTADSNTEPRSAGFTPGTPQQRRVIFPVRPLSASTNEASLSPLNHASPDNPRMIGGPSIQKSFPREHGSASPIRDPNGQTEVSQGSDAKLGEGMKKVVTGMGRQQQQNAQQLGMLSDVLGLLDQTLRNGDRQQSQVDQLRNSLNILLRQNRNRAQGGGNGP